jgi:WD40 repeat protein
MNCQQYWGSPIAELLYTKQLWKEEEKQKKECIVLIAWFKDEVWGAGMENQAVWAVSYHTSGDVLASSSLDHTSRIWDLYA